MLHELVCCHLKKKRKHYLFLSKPAYSIGKALDNDIVLLDTNAPAKLANLKKIDGKYVWMSIHHNISTESHFRSDDYEFIIRNHHKTIILVLFLLGLMSAMSVFNFFHSSHSGNAKNPIQLPARGNYGNLDESKPIHSVAFEFQAQNKRYSVLHYTPGNIANAQDLKIEVNGAFLGFVPISMNKWNVEQAMSIPSDILQKEHNRLVFGFQGNSQSSWAVRQVYVDEKDTAPEMQNGLELLKNAEKIFRERNVRKGNLIRAQQFSNQAGLFYYTRHETYPDVLQQMITKIQTAKTTMINDYQLEIKKYQQEGDLKRARRVYRNLMNELVDPMDADRSKLLREYESLDE